MQRIVVLSLSILGLLWLTGCGAPAPAPVVERPQPPSQKIRHHVVSRDETLYSIAWRYELDFQQLARINGLRQPYQLLPGQRLSLDMSRSPSVPETPTTPPRGATAYPLEKTDKPRPAPPPKVTLPSPPALPAAGWGWQWPARGAVEREYDVSRVLKGISIDAGPGAAVAAAAPGVVVYAGDGLRGYGSLIILKHSNEHLSAYAHNRKILVSENQSVAQGEKIAEIGVDNSGKHRLYFEIRKNGKPVDPLTLLPR